MPRWAWASAAGVAMMVVGTVALLTAVGWGGDGEVTTTTGPGYVGAFRVPDGTIGDSTFAWGGTALAFHPANNSLFLVGHDHHQAVAEIQIPRSIVNSRSLKDLPTAKVLQPFVKVATRIPNSALEGNVKVGGLMVVNGQLFGTLYEYYDADCNAVQSHFRLDSLNLATARAHGLYQVGDLGGGFVGGYMAPIPAEWQAELGAPYLTGQATLCIIGRTSAGPAAFGFDPGQLGPGAAPATPYLYYPLKHPLGPHDDQHPVYNGTTEIKGVAFLPGTGSVAFFGSHGTGQFGYGDAATFNDPYRVSKGPHSQDGQYTYQVWAYDLKEFVAVKNGTKKPWEVQPSAVTRFDLPFKDGAKRLGGVAFDPATGRLYVSQLRTGGGDAQPLIHVFQVSKDRSLDWLQANPPLGK
jgi:hypothetical protein